MIRVKLSNGMVATLGERWTVTPRGRAATKLQATLREVYARPRPLPGGEYDPDPAMTLAQEVARVFDGEVEDLREPGPQDDDGRVY